MPMNLLRGQLLIDKRGEPISADDALRDARRVVLYFSASWCPPCQLLLPLVIKMRENARERDLNLEVIFVPADHDNDEMIEFFVKCHGPWFALSAGAGAEAIRKKFHVHSIPSLIVLTARGALITADGRKDIEDTEDPLSVWFRAGRDEDESSKPEEKVANESVIGDDDGESRF